MSQTNVERVIGILVTDEAIRRRYVEDPQTTLAEIAGTGIELTGCERRALACIDPVHLAKFAKAIDARLEKSDLKGWTVEGDSNLDRPED